MEAVNAQQRFYPSHISDVHLRTERAVVNGEGFPHESRFTASKDSSHLCGEQFADVGVCASTGVPIRLCYQTFGQRDAVGGAVLLIMGLASPSLFWDMKFCECLAGHGYYVIRFDNRDVGRSTFLTGLKVVPVSGDTRSPEDLLGTCNDNSLSFLRSSYFNRLGDMIPFHGRLAFASLLPGRQNILRAVYTLEDMARDCIGLLDALKIPTAHVVGMCMGGMIAQIMAIQHPTRVESLALLSTHTSSRQAAWPSLSKMISVAKVTARIVREGFAVPLTFRGSDGCKRPLPKEEEALVHALVRLIVLFAAETGSPYSIDRLACARQLRRILRRSSDFSGIFRQYAALLNAPSRVEGLKRIHVPTVILHGTKDPLVPHVNAQQLVDVIPRATLVSLEGLGHVLHPALRERIVTVMVENMRRSKSERGSPGAMAKL